MLRVTGYVVKAEVVAYTSRKGEPGQLFRATIDSGIAWEKPVKVSGPVELLPEVGEFVDYRVSAFAVNGNPYPWVALRVIEAAPVRVPS